ncbi:MAG: hypothetical protein ACTSYA_02515 [Candidatus Kariarchaeaceae archaeon]
MTKGYQKSRSKLARLRRSKRGVTAVISTVIIFSLMLIAMTYLYTRIVPILENYDTQSETSASKIMMETIDQAFLEAMYGSSNKLITVDLDLARGTFDHGLGNTTTVTVKNITASGNVAIPGESYSYSSGLFIIHQPGTFTEGDSYRTYMHSSLSYQYNVDGAANGSIGRSVLYYDTNISQRTFNLYYRPAISLTESSNGAVLNIHYFRIVANSSEFPVYGADSQLTISKNSTQIFESSYTVTGIEVTCSVDGTSGDPTYFVGVQQLTIKWIITTCYMSF